MKKVAIVSALCVIFTLTTIISCLAESYSINGASGNSLSVYFTINGGQAQGSGKASTIPGYNAKVTVSLQRQNVSGNWQTIMTETGALSENTVSVSRSISSGTYRIVATAEIYNNANVQVDNLTKYSVVKTY